MSLAADLLEQAAHLATMDRGRPKQASLRRSVSTAYYSVFHLLLDDAARYLVAGSRLRSAVARSFDHRGLREAAQAVTRMSRQPTAHPKLRGFFNHPLAAELAAVCKAFVDLQEARHEADYNVGAKLTRQEATALVGQAVGAHAQWQHVRDSHNAHAFVLLAANLLKER